MTNENTRRYIAQLLGLDPSQEKTWPDEIIDRLVQIYDYRGRHAMYEEAQRLIQSPQRPPQ